MLLSAPVCASEMIPAVDTLQELVFVALQLGAMRASRVTQSERRLAERAARVPSARVVEFGDSILAGNDPLGENFSLLKDRAARRPLGATYTPASLVSIMTQWVAATNPTRVVDPGAGSGRFVVAAGRAIPEARLIAVECDPMAALLLRAHVRVAGLAKRCRVVVGDYRDVELPRTHGKTAFLGNPPYVRHHLISAERKRWYAAGVGRLGYQASKLAGLHVHFFVAAALQSAPGDVGAFVTAAEWLDVNYGVLLRQLLLGRLGLSSLDLLEPSTKPFADADTTAVVTCFHVGARPKSLNIRRIAALDKLGALAQGRAVARERFENASRWTSLSRAPRSKREGFVELGELCQVHRGQVTGANRIWIAGPHSASLPQMVLFASITHARELFTAGSALRHAGGLQCVIDIPADLERVPKRLRPMIEEFLEYARAMGADQGYIARHRKAWWSVGLREPAPILASYMARRAPVFVHNVAHVRHINIAHGIYPRERMPRTTLLALIRYLRSSVSVADGRVYAGGLAKFEPKEMERLLVPGPSLLVQSALVSEAPAR
jgi:adenine-specific DNA-methyltransferase